MGRPIKKLVRREIVDQVRVHKRKATAVAREYRVSLRAVYSFVKKWDESKKLTPDKGGSTRWKLSPEQISQAKQHLVCCDPLTTDEFHQWLESTYSISLTARTVRIWLKKWGFTSRHERIVPDDKPEWVVERKEFQRQHKKEELKDWVFEDECVILLRQTGRQVWVMRGDPTPTRSIKGVKGVVCILGALWNDGHQFRQYDGWTNANKYLSFLNGTLKQHAVAWSDHKFLHEQTALHNTKTVTKWFDQHGINPLENSLHSPQWNAMEYAWKYIREQVKKQSPHSIVDLKAAVESVCNNFPDNVRKACIRKAQARLRGETVVRQLFNE